MLKGIVSSLVVATSLFAMNQEELNSFKNNNLLKANNIHFLAGKKISNNFAMIKAYADVNGNYSPLEIITDNNIVIVNGTVYNAKTKKRLTVDVDYKSHLKDAAFTIGNGKKDLFLFTEGECPYCQNFEDNLINFKKDEYKMHVFLYPLEQIHYFAKDMSIATLSQPKEKRGEYYKKLMDLHKNNKKELVKELSKYSIDLYKKILAGVNSLNQTRESQLSQKYMKILEMVEGKRFNGVADVIEYCKSKIKNFEKDKTKMSYYLKVESILNKQLKFAGAYMGVQGTPSLFDINGQQFDTRKIFTK